MSDVTIQVDAHLSAVLVKLYDTLKEFAVPKKKKLVRFLHKIPMNQSFTSVEVVVMVFSGKNCSSTVRPGM